jgi:hypothetical protein
MEKIIILDGSSPGIPPEKEPFIPLIVPRRFGLATFTQKAMLQAKKW